MKERNKDQTIIFLLLLTLCICLSSAVDPATCISCRKSHMCNPPDCFCCRDEMPLQDQKIPQMVFFTFDDAVNPQVASFYRELFDASRVNPNGCPIKMTLFISHSSTVYSLVKEFYQKGMEIASHSVTHSNPNPKTFLNEAKKQKENLIKRAKIPANEIKGWRSPFLKPLGDKQPDVLKELGYEYDATLTIIKPNSQDKAPIPFTLDYGWPYDCKIQPCPKKEHKGFWEVPVVSVKDYLDKYNCVYIDGCNIPPPSEELAYKFLWDNFENYYKTNRAPMGINMHASWFYYPDRKKAMSRFIQDILKLGDVYIVSVSQVIDWLRHPTPLSSIKSFGPWQCNGKNSSIATPAKVYDLRAQTLQQRQQENVLKAQMEFETLKQRRVQTAKETLRTQPETGPVVINMRPTKAPVNPGIVYMRTIPTRAPPRHYVQNLQHALVIRPPQTPVRQIINVRPAQANFRQGLIHIRPQSVQRLSNVMPSQVPMFPWTRQQFLEQIRNPPPPPLAPNHPAVRFWWRPPQVRLPNPHPTIHIVRPQQRILPQPNLLQLNMQRHQEMERQRQLAHQQALERQRQLDQERQEAIKRQQALERQRQQELERQEVIKRQQALKRLQELHKQKELLQKQELERQRLEEFKRQEELKRKQEEEMKRKLIQQKEMEKQRLLEIKRQQNFEQLRMEKLRTQEIQRKEELKRQQEITKAKELKSQLQLSKKVKTQTRNKDISKQHQLEQKKIKQLRQLAESNFLKLQEMEQQSNNLKTTTMATRMTPKLGGKSMWQMDTSALKQLNTPWKNWVTPKPSMKDHNTMPPVLHKMRLSEFNVEPVKKSRQRVATFTSFKPQTVFSINDFIGPKSFSVADNKHYWKNLPSEVVVQPLGGKSIVIKSTSVRSTTPAYTSKAMQPNDYVVDIKLTSHRPKETTAHELTTLKPKPTAADELTTLNPKPRAAQESTTLKPKPRAAHKSTTLKPKPAAAYKLITLKPKSSTSATSTSKMTTDQGNAPTAEDNHPKQNNTPDITPSESITSKNTKVKVTNFLAGRCIQEGNCKLPECFCKTVSPPNGLLPEKTPQMVYITVDGSIDFHSYSNIQKIFQKTRLNPNGCPIKGTVFATDADSNYLITKMLHSNNFEIAMKGLKSVSYKSTETLEQDIRTQRQRLAKNANVPSADIKGWRSPGLKPLGDAQFEILRNSSLYDSTLILPSEPGHKNKLWPFTLEYGWRERCEIKECPVGGHSGVWEVPIIPLRGPKSSRSCEYVDSCANQPNSEKETIKFLMDNFNQYYKANRAPFAIRLQQVWFHWHYAKNLSGLIKFLDEILQLGDVYVIPVTNVLEWMKNPTSVDKIKDFQPWSC